MNHLPMYNQCINQTNKKSTNNSQTLQKELLSTFLIPTLNHHIKMLLLAVTFIKDNNAYILFKRADGTNEVYIVVKKDNKWEVIDKKSKQGKLMKKELIWYM